MAETVIYQPDGRAIEPGDAADADNRVQQVINNDVDLFVDPSTNEVVARIKIKGSSGGRPQKAVVRHVWETRDTVFKDLLNSLRRLERRRPDGAESSNIYRVLLAPDDGQPVEDSYTLPQLLATTSQLSFDEFGLNPIEQLVLLYLLQQREQLVFGMNDHVSAAVAVRHFITEWHTAAPITIARKTGATVPDTPLQLVVDSTYRNFDWKADETGETNRKTSQWYKRFREDIAGHLAAIIKGTIEKVLTADGTPHQKYADLETLRAIVDADDEAGSEADLNLPASKAVLEHIELVDIELTSHEVSLQLDLTELAAARTTQSDRTPVLSQGERSALRREISEYIDNQLTELETELQQRTLDIIIEPVKELEQGLPEDEKTSILGTLETQYCWLRVMRQQANDVATPGLEDAPAPVAAFERRLQELNENRQVAPVDRAEILAEVVDRIDTALQQVQTAAEQRLETLLNEIIADAIEQKGSPQQRYETLQRLRDRLEQFPFDTSGVTDTNLGEEFADDAVPRRLQRFADMNVNVVDEGTKQTLAATQLSEIDSELTSIRETRIERFETSFESIRESLVQSDVAPGETISRLETAQRWCAGVDDETVRWAASEEFDELQQLLNELNEDPILNTDDKQKLRQQFESALKESTMSIQTRYVEKLQTQFKQAVDRFHDAVDGRQMAYEWLTRVERWIEDGVPERQGGAVDHPVLETVADIIDQALGPSKEEAEGLLDRSAQDDLRSAFLTDVRERKEHLRTEGIDHYVERIDHRVTRIVESSRSDREALDRVLTVERALKGSASHEINRPGRSTDEQVAAAEIDRAAARSFTDQMAREIRERTRETVRPVREQIWQREQERILERFERALDEQLYHVDENTAQPLAKIDDNIKILNRIKGRLQSTIESGAGGREVGTVGRRGKQSGDSDGAVSIIKEIGQEEIPEEDVKAIRSEATSIVESRITKQQEHRNEELEAGLDTVVDELIDHDDFAEKIHALAQLRRMIDRQATPIEPQNELLAAREVDIYVEELDGQQRSEIRDRLDGKIADAVDTWRNHVVRVVKENIGAKLSQGVNHRQNRAAVVNFRNNLPDPGRYADGERGLNQYQRDEQFKTAAQALGEFVAAQEDDTRPISADDVSELERRTSNELDKLLQQYQSNQFLQRMEDRVIGAIMPYITPLIGKRAAVRGTLLSGRGVLVIITVAAVIAVTALVAAGGGVGLGADIPGIGGGLGAGSGTGGPAVAAVTNVSISTIDDGKALAVRGAVRGDVKQVIVALETQQPASRFNRSVTVSNRTFRTRFRVNQSAAYALTITPQPEGRASSFQWSGTVSTAESGTNTTATSTPTPSELTTSTRNRTTTA